MMAGIVPYSSGEFQGVIRCIGRHLTCPFRPPSEVIYWAVAKPQSLSYFYGLWCPSVCLAQQEEQWQGVAQLSSSRGCLQLTRALFVYSYPFMVRNCGFQKFMMAIAWAIVVERIRNLGWRFPILIMSREILPQTTRTVISSEESVLSAGSFSGWIRNFWMRRWCSKLKKSVRSGCCLLLLSGTFKTNLSTC